MLRYNEINPLIDIFVLTRLNNDYKWFLADRENWLLDTTRLYEKNKEEGYLRAKEDVVRNSWEEFLDKIQGDVYTTQELREFLLREEDDSWNNTLHIHLYPQLYIDFDNKAMYDMYSEPYYLFEKYLPSDWTHYESGNFPDAIPPQYRYWEINGVNFFDKFEYSDPNEQGVHPVCREYNERKE